MDAPHAAVQEHTARLLSARGWSVKVEVSFNYYGERGRIDILAFHPATASLLVVEIKSAIGDVQDLLGRLDVKTRIGRTVASEVGWVDVRTVLPAVVIAEGSTARRVLQQHATLFARFDRRGRGATAWLRDPWPPAPRGLLWFVRLSDAHPGSVTRVVRVRRPGRGR